MESIHSYLSGDHKSCDQIFADLENSVVAQDWEKSESYLENFLQVMKSHFSMEEEIFFPAFDEVNGSSCGPTAMMRQEHIQMNAVFAQLKGFIEKKEKDNFLSQGEGLMILMQQHNMKEEQMLYPMGDRALGPQVAQIIEAMQKLKCEK